MTKIKVSKNGPYLVSGSLPLTQDIVHYDNQGSPLKTSIGKTFSQKKDYALCRCGHSINKPFCTGVHKLIKFDGTENPEAKEKFEDQIEITDGPDLILKDAPKLCAGAGFCHRNKGTWQLTENSDDPESKKMATEEACCCTAGRLVACDKKTGKNIEPKLEKSIGLTEDGPLYVKGGVPIEAEDSSIYEVRNRVTLCRCGKSQNKPFCDASHQD
ncbi:MAG: CDGSH iron-sulfur domain-containing protein [Candidatus Shapirobacteria bacterium]